VGDNNSLIAKGFFGAAHGKEKIDMFLDPKKIKDYMRVEDFCDAVATVVDKELWNDDWNVAAETPENTGKIVEMMSEISCKDLKSVVKWHPGTDYLGNHRLSSQKFRDASGWTPKFDLYNGLEKSWNDIQRNLGSTDYNPLRYLEDAKKRGLDLTQFFNR
jgi:dTDP-D-glucose 4,6-dehydratase